MNLGCMSYLEGGWAPAVAGAQGIIGGVAGDYGRVYALLGCTITAQLTELYSEEEWACLRAWT